MQTSWQLSFEAIGTRWVIDIFDTISSLKKQQLESKIKNRIEIFDKIYSRFRSDSLICTIAKQPGQFTFPDDAKQLFDLYYQLYQLTNGLFTPLIGNVLEDAGYDATYSLKSKEIKKPKTWAEVLDYHHPTLVTKQPVTLDFGAGGKGYLIDLVGEIIKDFGLNQFCVDAGGDIFSQGQKSLTIGLENPMNLNQVIGKVDLLNQSICGSAGNRRAWGQFHHIIDPKTLQSVIQIVATWVIADSTILADALSTCLFLVPSEVLTKEFKFEYLILYKDFSIEKSSNFNAEIFYQNEN